MDRPEALDLFRSSVADILGVEPAEIELSRSWDDYEIDSLGLTEIALLLTDTFEVHLPDVDPEEFETVGQAFELVTRALRI
ncbi:MAG: hypothetical protein NVSMB16_09560 [Acidimicrobiales bacterium]